MENEAVSTPNNEMFLVILLAVELLNVLIGVDIMNAIFGLDGDVRDFALRKRLQTLSLVFQVVRLLAWLMVT